MRTRWLVASLATAMLVTGTAVTAVAVRQGQARSPLAGHALGALPAADATSGTPQPSTTSQPRRTEPVAKARATPVATPKPAAPKAKPAPAGSKTDASPLAGRIKPGATYRGLASWYDAGGSGACLLDVGGDSMTAAMNWSDYESSKACGAYIRVRASTGASVTVRITNECPAPCRIHQVDLSPQAYAKLADPKTGQISVTWKLLSPQISGGIAVRYKSGSSRYWCGIQVINHRNPVAVLEVYSGGSWRKLSRTEYNHFLSPAGSGCGSSIRITDIYGQQLVLGALPIKPDTTQPTGKQFSQH